MRVSDKNINMMFRLSSYTVCVFVCDRMLQEYMSQPDQFNINCVDPLNRSALIAVIENENINLIRNRPLLDSNIRVKVRSTKSLAGLLQQRNHFTINFVDPLCAHSRHRERNLLDNDVKVNLELSRSLATATSVSISHVWDRSIPRRSCKIVTKVQCAGLHIHYGCITVFGLIASVVLIQITLRLTLPTYITWSWHFISLYCMHFISFLFPHRLKRDHHYSAIIYIIL